LGRLGTGGNIHEKNGPRGVVLVARRRGYRPPEDYIAGAPARHFPAEAWINMGKNLAGFGKAILNTCSSARGAGKFFPPCADSRPPGAAGKRRK